MGPRRVVSAGFSSSAETAKEGARMDLELDLQVKADNHLKPGRGRQGPWPPDIRCWDGLYEAILDEEVDLVSGDLLGDNELNVVTELHVANGLHVRTIDSNSLIWHIPLRLAAL